MTGTTQVYKEMLTEGNITFGCCSSSDPCNEHLRQRATSWQKRAEEAIERIKELEEENLHILKENKEMKHYLRELKENINAKRLFDLEG